MAGHSHWKQIKEHKGVADKKRGALFGKLLRAIAAAAKHEPNPQFNPRLRTTLEKARAAGVPQENIERALARTSASAGELEELIIEAYGAGGTALLIEAITDNRNRTIAEVKLIIKENGARLAEPGSVRWAFEESGGEFHPKFPQKVNDADRDTLAALVAALGEHDDIQRVTTNMENNP